MMRFFKHSHNWFKDNWFKRRWLNRCERFYRKNRWHLVLDISLGIIIILLITTVIALYFYHPSVKNIIDQPLPERLELNLNNPPLIFDFSAAASSFNDNGDVELTVKFNNSGKIAINDIKVDFLTLDKNFSVNQIKLADSGDESGIEINNRKLVLGLLNAGEGREIKINVRFKNNNPAIRTVKWQAQEEYLIKGQIIKESLSLPDLYLKSELKAKAVIYYNSPQGDELGSGPLPPLAGLPTNYWVFFDVESAGEFKDLVFSAKLPAEVELTDRRSILAGDFSYNPSSRQIIWKIPELKNQDDGYRAGFEIQFMPNDKQVGGAAVLLSGAQCYARDSLTGAESHKKLDDLDTNLNFDKINKGAGIIGRP